ncbi:helix-turn-helix domain-containing protein [Rathayibacter soli]|uniref:helix-turn-helix domain-containing protein n=1 Tax=Rathayibacter soli TaxID=3144168 RepID=UPI0027E595BB|nr:helix-turn-helix domain-containing protein [Glaciibacter superstes]
MMTITGLPDFARRLNALFASTPDPETGKPFTNVTVAEALNSQGVGITHAYLGQLRNGRKNEPSASLVGGLAQFFNVSAEYFFGRLIQVDSSELGRRLQFLSARPDANVDVDDLRAVVVAHGESFDGETWKSLHNGSAPTRMRQDVLEAIADYFDVPHEYLTAPNRDDRVDLIEAQIELIDALAATGSTGLSLRSVGQPTPHTLRAIAAALKATRDDLSDEHRRA